MLHIEFLNRSRTYTSGRHVLTCMSSLLKIQLSSTKGKSITILFCVGKHELEHAFEFKDDLA